jgi:hypothetical protein
MHTLVQIYEPALKYFNSNKTHAIKLAVKTTSRIADSRILLEAAKL